MISQAVNQAAGDVATYLIKAYRSERGVHAETIIGAAAALTGEFALRATEPMIPDGWVLSDKVNWLLFQNEEKGEVALWSVIRAGAERVGAPPEALPDPHEVVGRVASKIGGSPFPPLSIPDENYPHEWSPNACPRLRGGIEKIAVKHGLSDTDRAMALAFAIAMLIDQTQEVLPPVIAATLALEVMIGVSRMGPLREPIPA